MKKKKRKVVRTKSQMMLIAALSVLVFSIAIIAISSVFLSVKSNAVFATEAWIDPYDVCTTELVYPEQDDNPPEIMQALFSHELPVSQTFIRRLHGVNTCPNIGDINSSILQEVYIYLDSTMLEVNDDGQSGLSIYKVLSALSETEIALSVNEVDMLSVIFLVDDVQHRRWRMNYIQAMRAYEAGITGQHLLELGQRR